MKRRAASTPPSVFLLKLKTQRVHGRVVGPIRGKGIPRLATREFVFT